jgi:hypothetical protein
VRKISNLTSITLLTDIKRPKGFGTRHAELVTQISYFTDLATPPPTITAVEQQPKAQKQH